VDDTGGAYSTHERDEKCVILIGKPEWKRSLGRPSRRSEDNIKIDLREIGWEGVDWIHLVQD
jgi:hypothetical protein